MNESDLFKNLEADMQNHPQQLTIPMPVIPKPQPTPAKSKWRPEGVAVNDGTDGGPIFPVPPYTQQLRLIRNAVRAREGLEYGALNVNGGHCAIGCFFADHPNMALKASTVDEIAAFNDSIPRSASPRRRRNEVVRWLNRRLFWDWTRR